MTRNRILEGVAFLVVFVVAVPVAWFAIGILAGFAYFGSWMAAWWQGPMGLIAQGGGSLILAGIAGALAIGVIEDRKRGGTAVPNSRNPAVGKQVPKTDHRVGGRVQPPGCEICNRAGPGLAHTECVRCNRHGLTPLGEIYCLSCGEPGLINAHPR